MREEDLKMAQAIAAENRDAPAPLRRRNIPSEEQRQKTFR